LNLCREGWFFSKVGFAASLVFARELAFAVASRVAHPQRLRVYASTCQRAPLGETSRGRKNKFMGLWRKEKAHDAVGEKKKFMIACLPAPVFQHPLLQSFTEQ